MTANDPTPAEVRGAEALKAASGVTFPWAMSAMPKVLAAAYDVEEMAEVVRIAQGVPFVGPKQRKIAEAIRAAQLGEHA